MDHGLKLTKYHRILLFDDFPWMKPYIDFNSAKRKEAKNRQGIKAQLIFTDSDSLCYAIETGDFYQDMKLNSEEYDMCEMVRFEDETNKNVIDRFKDETNDVPVESFIGWRSKVYSIMYKRKQKATTKGVKKV